jgi:hypothetical protein
LEIRFVFDDVEDSTLTTLTSSVLTEAIAQLDFPEARFLKLTLTAMIPAMSNHCENTSCYKVTITKGPATAVVPEITHVFLPILKLSLVSTSFLKALRTRVGNKQTMTLLWLERTVWPYTCIQFEALKSCLSLEIA